MDRRYLVAGNWKMNKQLPDALALTRELLNPIAALSDAVEVVVAPPALYLHPIQLLAAPVSQLHVAAQTCHHAPQGAYTGEISAPMLASMDLDYVILGHSERREYFGEDAALLAQKVDAALETDLQVIFCCGEPLLVREQGTHEAYVQQQLEESLWHRSAEDFERIVIAYEPIWAIGTGKTATPDQAQAMHAFLRSLLADQYGTAVASKVRLLYGGSCKPSNAADLFAQPDIDGALVGGASLKAADFLSIINARLSQS